jgi:chromosome segregation ATPase
MKSESERRSLSVRLPSEMIERIEKSGEVPSAWLRQAVRLRMDREQQAGNTLDAVDARMNRLEQEVAQLRKEIVKLQQLETIVQSALLDLRKTLTAVQQNQVEFRHLLERQDASFGVALNTLGSSLLAALSQQLRELVKAPEEPPRRLIPPAPPRTRL